ncbi:hypothetical protein [Chryseobacterium viscerum]|uniref:Uncharacterized protein n=1 Tax=Chryseobacterium viscerum TaxID=1037377 RepID=A0A5N4BSW6_9FLAO|nr:hypothetical protein [Chryseobacterium viscerum]KAB1231470.1 hypothetical protein F8D52_06590 [Chryseobacterium viscerum]
MNKLTRFWFTFEDSSELPPTLKLGCGVTGYNHEDALILLKQKIFKGNDNIIIKNYIENIDLTRLDPNHILPNILPPNFRGIWYPLGYN